MDIMQLTDEALDDLIMRELDETGCTLEELLEEAEAGRFESESKKRLWFAISGLLG